MHQKLLHKRIKIVSLVIGSISLIGTVIGLLPNFIDLPIAPISILFLIFSIMSLVTSFAIIFTEKKWIRKAAKYNLFIYPALAIVGIISLINSNSTFLFIVVISVLILLTIIFLIQIFIFSDPVSLTSTIILISLFVIGMLIKRFHLPFAGTLLTISLGLLSFGGYSYGIRCLYLGQNISFLKYAGFLGSCVFTFSFLGLLFKLQHWPLGNFFVNIANFSFVLGTLIILLTLPSSGFLDWKPFHKKVLRRLLLPYVLIFFLFVLRFLLPEVNTFIFSPTPSGNVTGFEMSDYPIENKNGL
jgi:hypothetical protein